ncbi:MAG: DVU0259 family response regulator domain-containing protein [Desulfatibacillaceae bacterium]
MAKRILVIDDDPAVVKYLTTLFEDNGYETAVAGDGPEGFEQATREAPDLITLDLQMPTQWGPQLYRRLMKKKEFADVPVIVVSGLAGKHAIPKAVAFVKKPFDPDKLLGIVKDTIGEP